MFQAYKVGETGIFVEPGKGRCDAHCVCVVNGGVVEKEKDPKK